MTRFPLSRFLFPFLLLLPCDTSWSQPPSNKKDKNAADSPASPDTSGFRYGGGEVEYGGSGPKNRVETSEIIVVVSEDSKTAYGFSKQTGKWTSRTLPQVKHASSAGKSTRITPIAADSVAAIQIGRVVCAYSGPAGKWSVLEVAGKQPFRVAVQNGLITVTVRDEIYTFAAAGGTWTSPSSSDGPSQKAAGAFVLDGAEKSTAEALSSLADLPQDTLAQDDAKLRRYVAETEARTLAIAKKVRLYVDTPEADPKTLQGLKDHLTQAVATAFSARQTYEQHRIRRMAMRLQRLRKQLDARHLAKESIVRRRVEELLDPKLGWDSPELPSRAETPAEKKYLQLLEAQWKSVEAAYRAGRGSTTDMMESLTEYKRALVARARGREQQQAARQDLLETLRQYAKITQEQYKAGRIHRSELLRIEAEVAKVEMELQKDDRKDE